MKEFKTKANKNSNISVLPSSIPEENEKKRPLYTLPNFPNLVTSVVTEQILNILAKNELSEVAEDKYESSVILPGLEGAKAVSKELQDASESYAELKGCDPDLPAILNPPSEAHLKNFLIHDEE